LEFILLCFVFWWYWGLNSGIHTLLSRPSTTWATLPAQKLELKSATCPYLKMSFVSSLSVTWYQFHSNLSLYYYYLLSSLPFYRQHTVKISDNPVDRSELIIFLFSVYKFRLHLFCVSVLFVHNIAYRASGQRSWKLYSFPLVAFSHPGSGIVSPTLSVLNLLCFRKDGNIYN
jgi:hypothetical protein